MAKKKIGDLFRKPIVVINVGLPAMAQSIRDQQIPVVEVDWHAPIEGVQRLRLTQSGIVIDEANDQVCQRIQNGRPVLVGMGIAGEVIPGMNRKMILHAGPPIKWEQMCGPMRGAIMGALVYEGWAKDEKEAERLASSGNIELSPGHDHHAVGPLTGVISPRMPVFIVENKTLGNFAYAPQKEGSDKKLSWGSMDKTVIKRLYWMEQVLYPILDKAIRSTKEPLDLNRIIAEALHMGDECHNRNRAATSLFLGELLPALAHTNQGQDTLAEVFEYIRSNDQFFLNLSMAAAKATLDAAEGVQGSTIVSVMARNGVDFGIKLAGLPQRWFTAPAEMVNGLYYPGYNKEDANRDIGDGIITETAGYGGFAMAAAPEIIRFVGGTPQDAYETTMEMYEISYDEHGKFTIPALNFRGTPLGIDVRRVMETGILPSYNTEIVHKNPAIGIMIGAGILRAPEKCFRDAFDEIKTW